MKFLLLHARRRVGQVGRTEPRQSARSEMMEVAAQRISVLEQGSPNCPTCPSIIPRGQVSPAEKMAVGTPGVARVPWGKPDLELASVTLPEQAGHRAGLARRRSGCSRRGSRASRAIDVVSVVVPPPGAMKERQKGRSTNPFEAALAVPDPVVPGSADRLPGFGRSLSAAGCEPQALPCHRNLLLLLLKRTTAMVGPPLGGARATPPGAGRDTSALVLRDEGSGRIPATE